MPLDLTPFLFPNMNEDAAREEGRRAEQNAIRAATAGAQSRGALNPAAGMRLASQVGAEQRAAQAGQLAQARAADQGALGQSITGAIGTGLSTIGGIGAMSGLAGGGAQGGGGVSQLIPQVSPQPAQPQPAPLGPAPAPGTDPRLRRPEEDDPLGPLGMILGSGGRLG